MSTTVTDGVDTIEPLQVLGYASTRSSKNVLHDIIGRADMEVTLHVAGLRSGQLQMLVATLADALALDMMHAAATTFRLEDTDLPGLDMTYVTAGETNVELDDETRARWIVSIDYQEVA